MGPQYGDELEASLSSQALRGPENLPFFSFPDAVTALTQHVLKFHSVLESGMVPNQLQPWNRVCAEEDRTHLEARPFLPFRATRRAVAMDLLRNSLVLHKLLSILYSIEVHGKEIEEHRASICLFVNFGEHRHFFIFGRSMSKK